MAESSLDLEGVWKLLREERALREKTEEGKQKAEEEKQKAEEGRQKAEEERRKAEEREQEGQRALRNTTLPEYINLCHEHWSKSIIVQTDKTRSTRGDPSNAKDKIRPDYLHPWDEFLQTQKATLELLYSIYPSENMPRVFESAHFVQTLGRRVASRKVASEADLENLQRDLVETPVTRIVGHMQTLQDVCEELKLGGGIEFENHLNGLSDDAEEVAERLEILRVQLSTPRHPALSKPPPRPDQVCVYTTVEGLRKPALIVEYKPPHKLTLAMLRHVLHPSHPPMELDRVINRVTVPSPEDTAASFEYYAERVVAAVVTQAFSYMVKSGTQYGYITTGEAFVFLHIKKENDMKIAYYHLAEPNSDVSAQMKDFPDTEDYMHRTAISQVLAFTFLALESAQRNLEWREDVIGSLKIWRVDYKAILKEIPETPEIPETAELLARLSDYRPQTYSLEVPVRSPVGRRLRSRKLACRPVSNLASEGDQDSPSSTDDQSSPPDTPTRPRPRPHVSGKRILRTRPSQRENPSQAGRKRSFCTQLCLKGLARRGALDRRCPNVSNHCEKGHQSDRHQLDYEEFRVLLGEQLRQSRGDACQPLGIQGARGALFKVTLISHGYTVAAKGTVRAFVEDLRHEAEVYRRLAAVQGVYVPVCLGSIDLERPFYYDAGICIIHLLLMSWSGERLNGSKSTSGRSGQMCTSDLVRAVDAIHSAGVLHHDIRMPNLLWSEETKRIVVIDFERAEIVKPVRPALLPMSPNRKRKRLLGAKQVDDEDHMTDVIKENPEIGLQVGLDMYAAQTMFKSKKGY